MTRMAEFGSRMPLGSTNAPRFDSRAVPGSDMPFLDLGSPGPVGADELSTLGVDPP